MCWRNKRTAGIRLYASTYSCSSALVALRVTRVFKVQPYDPNIRFAITAITLGKALGYKRLNHEYDSPYTE